MVYRTLVRPLLFSLPPETAHELALHSLSLLPSSIVHKLAGRSDSGPSLRVTRFGLSFMNPVGLAAGAGEVERVSEVGEEVVFMLDMFPAGAPPRYGE